MKKTSEAAVIEACKNYLKTIPGAYFRKRHGGPYNPGEPDLTGCIGGQRYEIEVKRPGEQRLTKLDPFERLGATKLQAGELHRWEAAGAVVGVVNSVEQLREIIEGR